MINNNSLTFPTKIYVWNVPGKGYEFGLVPPNGKYCAEYTMSNEGIAILKVTLE